jgi:hypothetical protein
MFGVKRSRREDGHSLSSSAGVKNECSLTYTPLVRPHEVDRDNSTSRLTVGQ